MGRQPDEHELGFSAKRPIFGGIAGVPQLTHDLAGGLRKF
ncbi:hypothetical protein CORMATOL_02515 [Corynebacterium matruchotii ATCC 33806]|uniref:Uncharacterized protein n=1 Tax=Corynebacterium matruchotii ATCC 33806 TaxID=566549 RepID=C0E682_9CORY|nr:hypothetical protein CORMATOL_02515 [Corynebacterium matruchotii ATCC 33806]